ncbi:hypothetical protein TNCV_3651381, partial [Trichonephila clavipes]
NKRKPVNTVWQKLFGEAVDENDGKRDLAVAVLMVFKRRSCGFFEKE